MDKYKYKDPVDNGYKKIFLSKKNHNAIFQKRKIDFFHHYDYYIKNDCFILHRTFNLKGKIALTFTLPIFIILNLSEAKETFIDYWKMLFSKKYGRFTSDMITNKIIIDKIAYLTEKE